MAAKNSTTSDKEDVMKQLEPFSKVLGKSVAQIWRVFVLRYVARGIAELFLAAFIVYVGWYVLNGDHRMWMLPFMLAGGLFVWDAIQVLIDPYYYAMNDVLLRIKSESLFLKGK